MRSKAGRVAVGQHASLGTAYGCFLVKLMSRRVRVIRDAEHDGEVDNAQSATAGITQENLFLAAAQAFGAQAEALVEAGQGGREAESQLDRRKVCAPRTFCIFERGVGIGLDGLSPHVGSLEAGDVDVRVLVEHGDGPFEPGGRIGHVVVGNDGQLRAAEAEGMVAVGRKATAGQGVKRGVGALLQPAGGLRSRR